jgi:hypothetical protein
VIERYRVVATRLRQELVALEQVVTRAKRAVALAREHPADQDLYLDAAALNLHDFYTGLERAFQQIAATVDETVPTGHDWHRELLCQMAAERPQVRPAVVSGETCEALDEYLRFRHVVRNIYAFEFDPDRLGRLVHRLDSILQQTRGELQAFADFLDRLAESDEDKG